MACPYGYGGAGGGIGQRGADEGGGVLGGLRRGSAR